MAGMIQSSVHHFDGCGGVGLAGNGGGSGNDGGGAAICGGLLVSAGIGTVETTFGVMSTVSVGGGTGGAGGGLSPGSGRVTTGGGDCLAHCNKSLERPGLPWYQHRLESTIRYDHHLPSWPGDDWHSVALAPELISSSTTAMDGPALVTLPAPLRRIFPLQASVVADLIRRNGAASHWSGMIITRPSSPIRHAGLDSRCS
jgi:hypothetical protein